MDPGQCAEIARRLWRCPDNQLASDSELRAEDEAGRAMFAATGRTQNSQYDLLRWLWEELVATKVQGAVAEETGRVAQAKVEIAGREHFLRSVRCARCGHEQFKVAALDAAGEGG